VFSKEEDRFNETGGVEMQINLDDEFSEELKSGMKLVVLPISRFDIQEEFTIGKYRFFPSDEVDISSLKPIHSDVIKQGLSLREVATTATGVTIDTFQTNTLIAFIADVDWGEFLFADHEYDLKLIARVSRDVERVMDIIKFHCCRADLIDSLPGRVGTWRDSGGFSTALIYNPEEHESYIIAGAVETHCVIKGVGLDEVCDFDANHRKFIESKSEVSSIARLALSMNTEFLESSNPTAKFVKAITILEYLAYPDKYEVFPEVKKQISLHKAKSIQEYETLKERFYELTGKKDSVTKEYIGYRTRIVHMGHYLEEILDNKEIKIKKLMLELQGYIAVVINHMIENHEMTWQEFLNFRKQRRISLGLQQGD